MIEIEVTPALSLAMTITEETEIDTMKYIQTINLSAGVVTAITTTVTTEPYNVLLLDSSGNDITSTVTINLALVGGVYVVSIYSAVALSNVKLKVLA
jgi:hypothetical protein